MSWVGLVCMCICTMSAECLESVWRVSWRCLLGVLRFSKGCVEVFGHVLNFLVLVYVDHITNPPTNYTAYHKILLISHHINVLTIPRQIIYVSLFNPKSYRGLVQHFWLVNDHFWSLGDHLWKSSFLVPDQSMGVQNDQLGRADMMGEKTIEFFFPRAEF